VFFTNPLNIYRLYNPSGRRTLSKPSIGFFNNWRFTETVENVENVVGPEAIIMHNPTNIPLFW
jgi:hypothetical protein